MTGGPRLTVREREERASADVGDGSEEGDARAREMARAWRPRSNWPSRAREVFLFIFPFQI